MKKLLLYGLSLSLVFSLAACASKSAPSDADTATDAVQTDQSQDNQTDDLTQAISNVKQSETTELEKRMIGAFYSVYYYSRAINPDKQASDCMDYELKLLDEDFAFFKDCGLAVPSDYKEEYKQWIADGCKTDGFEFYTQEELESEFNRVYSIFNGSDDDLDSELTELRHYCSLFDKLYPTDYMTRYIDWRPLDTSVNQPNQSGVYEETTPPQENTNNNKNSETSGSSGDTGTSNVPGNSDMSVLGDVISEGNKVDPETSHGGEKGTSTWG